MAEVQTEPESVRLSGQTFDLTEHVSRGLDVPRALLCLAHRTGLVALDSASGAPGRWSLVAFDPIDTFPRPRGAGIEAPPVLGELRRVLSALAWEGELPPGPFSGGFIGALAYDLGVEGEDLDLPPHHRARTPASPGRAHPRWALPGLAGVRAR